MYAIYIFTINKYISNTASRTKRQSVLHIYYTYVLLVKFFSSSWTCFPFVLFPQCHWIWRNETICIIPWATGLVFVWYICSSYKPELKLIQTGSQYFQLMKPIYRTSAWENRQKHHEHTGQMMFVCFCVLLFAGIRACCVTDRRTSQWDPPR